MKKATTKNWQIIIRFENRKYDEVWGLPFVATKAEATTRLMVAVATACRRGHSDYAKNMKLVETRDVRSEPIHFISFHCAND